MTKLSQKEYLQGKYNNLFGTILGFKRGRRYNNDFSQSNFFSFFLFFDHTTGRIERYLINYGFTKKVKVEDNFNEVNNIKPKIKGDFMKLYITNEDHINDPKYSFKILFNGRLDRRFFTTFIFN
jgi:hypothetical protein